MLLGNSTQTEVVLARHLSGEPDSGSLMATLVMSSWNINKHNEAFRRGEDEEEQQEDPNKKRKPKKPPAPPDHRLNPFDLGRREANPIGDHCYLTAPEYGLDMHETWDRGFVALCNMAGLTPLQASQLFVQRPSPSFVQIRDPWLPAGIWDKDTAWEPTCNRMLDHKHQRLHNFLDILGECYHAMVKRYQQRSGTVSCNARPSSSRTRRGCRSSQ